MRATFEICIDHDGTIPGADESMLQQILGAIGHDPVNCAFMAASRSGIVHGRIIEILWCDSRLLGVDVLGFQDGHVETASEENVDRWFREQGHRLVKIDGFKALGNTIVKIQITGADELPTWSRKTTLMRPNAPLEQSVIADRLSVLSVD